MKCVIQKFYTPIIQAFSKIPPVHMNDASTAIFQEICVQFFDPISPWTSPAVSVNCEFSFHIASQGSQSRVCVTPNHWVSCELKRKIKNFVKTYLRKSYDPEESVKITLSSYSSHSTWLKANATKKNQIFIIFLRKTFRSLAQLTTNW